MPKNANKKGKQKETPTAVPAHSAPPPPPPPPPPLAPPPPVMTIDTIEEEEEGFGELGIVEIDEHNEDSWEQMYDGGDGGDDDGDGPEDLNGWASKDPQNSNGGWADGDGWGTSAPAQEQMAPQPPAKDERHSKSQKKHQNHQQHPHPHQPQLQHHQHQQHQQPQSNNGWGSGGGAWDNTGRQAAPAPAKHQNAKWSQTTQRAMEPAWSTWSHEARWEQGGDTEEIEEEGWSSAEDDPWGEPATGWNQQQQSAHVPQAHTQRQPDQQSSWQTWGEEARRLPKSQQPYHAANLQPGTGGYFHPQGGDKQWSQQQAAMATTFQQQQEQAYALAQAQHRQQQQQQQQRDHNQQQQEQAYALAQAQHRQQQQHHNHNQPQQEQAYALAQAQHRQLQLQQQQQHHHHHQQQQHDQPQHEGKKHKKDKEHKHHHQSKKEKKRQQEQQPENDAWGLGEGWQDLEDDPEDHETNDGWSPHVHFSHSHTAPSTAPSMVVEKFTVNSIPPNKLGLSAYNMPAKASKTLAYAYHGTAAPLENGPARNNMHAFEEMRFVESQGAALMPVAGAFFGQNSRKAKERFHWMFPSGKDERVASLLAWINIQSVSYGLGSFGLHKFLQTRERGALVVNADYRPPNSPNEPAFDWLTYPELQKTMDRTLQESVAFYDPSMLVIVFVLLPSKTGNSLALWRRKIPVPSGVRLAYQAQITQAVAGLNRDYVVHVDEMPSKNQPPTAPPPKKRKWWKLWLSS